MDMRALSLDLRFSIFAGTLGTGPEVLLYQKPLKTQTRGCTTVNEPGRLQLPWHSDKKDQKAQGGRDMEEQKFYHQSYVPWEGSEDTLCNKIIRKAWWEG